MALGLLLLAVAVACCPEHGWAAESDAHQAEPIVSEIKIEMAGPPEKREQLVAMAKSLISLREGQRFSHTKFLDSLDSLKRSQLFQTIHVPDPDWKKPEIPLTFQLTPFSRIKDIKISGAFPLFEKEILNAMTIFTGDAFIPRKLPEQETNIAQIFLKEGYLSPKVRVTAEKDPEDGNHVVHVQINKGDFYRIKRVEIEGNRAFSGPRLKLRTDTWKATLFFGGIRRFIQKKLDGDVKNLTRFYRRKGYADVEVNAVVERFSDTKEVILHIKVNEGPKYKIEFEGNKEFWGFTLKKDLDLVSRGNPGDLGLKKGIRNIRDRYRKAGYPQTRVRMEELKAEDSGKLQRKIRLIIREGPRSVVHSIAIKGNRAFDDEKIQKQMLTRTPGIIADGEFVGKTLEEDKNAVKSLYLTKGYMSADVKEEIEWSEDKKKGEKQAALSLHVNEGEQTRVASIAFHGLNVLTQVEARNAIALKQGEPFRQYMIQSDENTLSALISEKGYPHVKVRGRALFSSANGQEAAVTYDVNEGPHVEMGEVYYTGNFRTRERIFQNEVELKPGQSFSLEKMLKAQRNIRNINALDSASFKIVGLDEKAERVNMIVEAEEKKPYYFQFGTGYDTRRKFYGNAKMGDRNLLGLNKDGWVSSEYSQIGYRNELGITEPRFLGTRISTTLNMFAEELEEFNKDFGTRTYGASLTFNRRFLKHFNATLSQRYERRDQYHVGSGTTEPEDEDEFAPRSILVTTPALNYNSTDSFIRPRKGVFSSLSMEISKGIQNSLDDFVKHRFELRYYYTPFTRLTFAIRGKYGRIVPYGSADSIPEDQLFFLGGTSDVRGFAENMLRFDVDDNPVGGRTSILGSLEARFDLGLNFELTTFYDTGSIRDTSDDEGSNRFRSSVGTGLRYITPIGPIGFLYGWKLDPKERESKGNLHFSIGYTF